MARIARQILPFLPLTRDADVQVARLIELHADDTATRTSGFRTAGRRAGRSGHRGRQSATALAAAGTDTGTDTDTVQRIDRLLQPAGPLTPVRQHLWRATATALALTPVLLALTPALVALALGRVPGA